MDARSEASFVHVHPDLVRVMRQANNHVAFVVIHGIRTPAEEAAMVAKGASTTTHSRHLPNKQGMACAVDVAALDDAGKITWEPHHYAIIAGAVKVVANQMVIPIEWGGDWKTFKDLGHFQLPWSKYP